MGQILSMKYDFLFKEVMSDKEILKRFLSDVLEIPVTEIKQIKYLNPILKKRGRQEKQGILDLLVELNHQIKVNVEIQLKKHPRWDKRALFYLAKTYTDDAKSGESYEQLKKCICISILDFDYTQQEKYHTVYRLRDTEGNEFSDLFEIHLIELGKKLNGNTIDEWIQLMNAGTREELEMMNASKNIGVRMAAMKMERLSLTQKMRFLYEAHMKEKRDRKWIEDGIREEARAEGLAEGRAEGQAKGLAEGRLEGIAKGIAKGITKGEIKGRINTYQEMEVSKPETIEKIAERFRLSRNEAERVVEEHWK